MSKFLHELNDDEYVVVDATTGTILGTNLLLVPTPFGYDAESVAGGASDSEIVEWATRYGVPIPVPAVAEVN